MSQQQRWPKNAEFARTETIRAAAEAERLLRRARSTVDHDPRETTIYIADTTAWVKEIQRLMVEARVGRDSQAA